MATPWWTAPSVATSRSRAAAYVKRGAHGRGKAHDLLHAVVLHVVEDEDALNRDRGAGGLGDRVTAGDQLVAGLDADRRLGAGARNRGLLGLAGLALDLALVGGMVGAVLGLGGRTLAFEATARVAAGADLRTLLGALLTDGAGRPLCEAMVSPRFLVN